MSKSSVRDARIDLLRGLAVLAMIIDHVAGYSPLRYLTGGDRFYTSAAEGFVILAGVTAGIVSLRAVERNTLRRTTQRFVRRAAMLYCLVTTITLIELPLSESLGLPWARGIDLHDPPRLAFEVITLGQTYHVADVLVLYALLFLLAPVAAYLLATHRTPLLVAGSVAAWLGYQLAPQVFGLGWLIGRAGTYGFPLAAWQILFCLSMAAGYHRASIARALDRQWRHRFLLVAGASSVLLVVVYSVSRAPHAVPGTVAVGAADAAGRGLVFAKDAVRVGRLVASLSIFSLLFAFASVLRERARRTAEWLLLPLGRHSLLAFVLHLAALVAVGATGALGSGAYFSPRASALLQLVTLAFVWMSVQLWVRLSTVEILPPRIGLVWQTAASLVRG